MDKILRWGVLSTAKIGVKQVIPAINQSAHNTVYAIASREIERARSVAEEFGIDVAYGSYEELLADPVVQAVYIPLPNHMHVPWIKRAVAAGKHVLCEKPMALHADEIEELIALRDASGLLIGEAFMVLHHPRWKRIRRLVHSGAIGTLRHIDGVFSFYNRDQKNIRNNPAYGGGSAYDIGVYPVVTSRLVFGEEPLEVIAHGSMDSEFGIDGLTSVIMRYPGGTAAFTCSMQLSPFQQMRVFGEKGVLTVDMPFNPPTDRRLPIVISTGILPEDSSVLESTESCNQYTLQAEAFYESAVCGKPFPGSLEHAYANERVIDAIYRSIKSGVWESV